MSGTGENMTTISSDYYEYAEHTKKQCKWCGVDFYGDKRTVHCSFRCQQNYKKYLKGVGASTIKVLEMCYEPRIFQNRAASFLESLGLIKKTSRGEYVITELGEFRLQQEGTK